MSNISYLLPPETKMRDLNKLIAQKQEQIQGLRKELDALLLTKRLMQGVPIPEKESGKMTLADMAAAILRDTNKPLHVKELQKKIHKKFGRNIKPRTLTAVLYTCTKRGKYFYKDQARKNTYGLSEWLVTETRSKSKEATIQ